MPNDEPTRVTPAQLDVATRFARALDEEDYAAATALLDPECLYTIRGETLRGPEAIVASYKGNGDEAAQQFDEIAYASVVRADEGGWIVITFSDRIRRGDRRHEHVCEQRVRVGAGGAITRIEHVDLPGEREALEAFKRSAAGA